MDPTSRPLSALDLSHPDVPGGYDSPAMKRMPALPGADHTPFDGVNFGASSAALSDQLRGAQPMDPTAAFAIGNDGEPLDTSVEGDGSTGEIGGPKPMTDAELLAAMEEEERDAFDFIGATVAQERAQALDYYFGRPFGTEEEGRSQAISTDVYDTIEGMMPGVCKPFISSDEVVQFDAQSAEDVEAAEQETAYVNYIFYRKNRGFEIIRNWIWDGLAQKVGVVKYWWDTVDDVAIEKYEGLGIDQITLLAQDPSVDIVDVQEHAMPNPAQQPPMLQSVLQQAMQGLPPGPPGPDGQPTPPQVPPSPWGPPEQLYDVTLRARTGYGCPRIAVVPPEEFLICRDATSTHVKEARFCGHRSMKSISYLRQQGYDVSDIDSVVGDDGDLLGTPEFMSRHFDDTYYTSQPFQNGPNRQVLVRELYPMIDFDGDGIAERRKVVLVGRTILLNEEVEESPFSAWTPNPTPHKFFGQSVADEVMDIQLQKSTVKRQILDNAYGINNNRMVVGPHVNYDDLLDNAVNSIIRIKQGGNVNDQVQSLAPTPIGEMLLPILEYLDNERESRSGFSRLNQGLDPDSINKTASGQAQVMAAGDERQQLIARTFAETGLKDLMVSLHGLIRRHATQADTFRLTNTWVTVDPREWRTRKDMLISVGLGTGSKQQQVANYQMLAQMQQQGMQVGLSSPQLMYNTAKKLTLALGEKDVSQFWQEPPPPPPPPDPSQSPQMLLQGKINEGLLAVAQVNAAQKAAADAADNANKKFGIIVDAATAMLIQSSKGEIDFAALHVDPAAAHQLGAATNALGSAVGQIGAAVSPAAQQ